MASTRGAQAHREARVPRPSVACSSTWRSSGPLLTGLFAGEGYPAVWGELSHDESEDWEFRTAATDPRAEVLYDLYDGRSSAPRSAIAKVLVAGDLDQRVDARPTRWQPSLRAVLCGLIEGYGRHRARRSDPVRDIDGRVGGTPTHWRTRIFRPPDPSISVRVRAVAHLLVTAGEVFQGRSGAPAITSTQRGSDAASVTAIEPLLHVRLLPRRWRWRRHGR